IFTTNAIYQAPETLKRPYYSSVDMSKYIALFIDTMNHDLSIEPLLSPVNRIHARLDRYKEKQKERNGGSAE
ncbi:MAG: ribose-phosphate pyrophosphokinase, partial [Lachnospiraceae bacterium]|nr:ribose-phosphate pyrophosphokinase [Lachnospiraceae bacterium]